STTALTHALTRRRAGMSGHEVVVFEERHDPLVFEVGVADLYPKRGVVVGLQDLEADVCHDYVPADVGEVRMAAGEVKHSFDDLRETGDTGAGQARAAVGVLVEVDVRRRADG